MDPTYEARVGDRLRAIRQQKRLSLHEVERESGKEFKASVLGAYERGERAISVPRLQRLANFYAVPVDRLLPAPDRVIELDSPVAAGGKLCIDLARIDQSSEPEAAIIGRYAAMIQMAREDYNGRMLTLRADDARALAAVLGTTPDSLNERLSDIGLIAAL